MHTRERRQQRARGVEPRGVGDHLAVVGVAQLLLLKRGRIHAHAQRLAQHQHIAHLRLRIALDAVRMHQPHGHQAVDGFHRVDGVAARNRNTCGTAHVLTAAHDLANHADR
ncbi:hypothetical protein SDC9_147737 [bioreactor metagenome]|uniref:Uncharacterized protein n=1 Tax=bioreactor metagenome TaxID=1076179 RepID=A0A645EGY7_9ZZZZ